MMFLSGRMGVLLTQVVMLLLLGSAPIQQTDAVRLVDFLPFGPDFDETLDIGNDPSATVDLAQPIPYFGQDRNQIIVENDGVLEFRSAVFSSSAFVYAFSADVDTTGIGQVFYRETAEPGLLQFTSSVVGDAFPELVPVSLTSLFIATWFYVGYFDNNIDRTNTFQCVIGTDGSQSFVALLYADDMIQWMTGDADGGMNGLGGDRADVGLVSEDPMNSFFLPASNTSAVLMLDSMSNVGDGGLWIFRVDQDMVIQPTDNLEPDGSGGSGSGSGSGSGGGAGNGLFGASCVAAGFSTCCVGTEAECTVGPSPIECSCSRDCYFSQTTPCCHDITVVPCFPEITITLTNSLILVPESQSAQVSIAVFGFPDGIDPYSFRSPLEAFILLYTGDGSAIAPSDYEGEVQVLEIFGNGERTVSIDINDDSEVEDTESFFVNITTTDDYVNILIDSTQVLIGDNDGPFMVALAQPVYVAQESNDEVSVCVTALSSTAMLNGNVAVIVRTESGTATESAPQDYSPTLTSVVFSPGGPSQMCVSIPIMNDNIFETEEIFTVILDNLDGTTPTDPSTASIVIVDDDVVIVGFNASDYTTTEGQPIVLCLQTVLGSTETTLSFLITTFEGSASSSDFSSGPFLLQILAGNDVGCIEIPTLEDTNDEGNEQFTVSAEPAGQDSGRFFVSLGAATVIIEDDDVVVPDLSISLEFATYTAPEADQSVDVCVVVDGNSLPSGRVAQFRIETSDQTATGGVDYESIDMNVNITALPAIMCLTIMLSDDSIIENTEQFVVTISSDDPAVSVERMQSPVFIEDSTTLTLEFMPTVYTVSESEGAVEVCVTTPDSVILERPISYSLQTIDDSAMGGLDYANTSDFVIISSAPFLNCTMIPIEDDSVAENTEQFFVMLGSTDDAVIIGTNLATVVILDISGVLVSFAEATYLADEDQGTVEVCLSLAGQLDRNLNVTISTVSGSATAADDFVAYSGFPVMFVSAPSQECVDIIIVDDSAMEQEELFEVEIDSQQADSAVSIGSLNRTTVAIADNDDVSCGVVLTSTTFTGYEGDRFATICLQLLSQEPRDASAQLVTVDGIGTATAGMDYEPLSATVMFLSSSGLNPVQCQNVTLLDDDTEEDDETFQVQISSSDCILVQSEATVTVIDDDAFNVLSFSQAVYTASESEGQVEVCANSLVPIARDALATIITAPQSANDGEDYIGDFLMLPLLRGESQSCLSISIVDDSILEDQIETFQVFLSSVDPGVDNSASMATVQIFDDDVSEETLIVFEQQTYVASETDISQEVCVIPSAALEPGQSISAILSTVDDTAIGGADYVPLADTTVTFTSTSLQRQCVNIEIIDDSEIEPIEQFFVQLDQTTSQGPISSQAVVSIMNDDVAIISFEMVAYSVGEGEGGLEVCAVPSAALLPGESISVLVSTQDGTATAGSDYTALVDQVLIFTLTPPRQCIEIEILDDLEIESEEDFLVRIDQTTPQGVVSNVATVTILDDDVGMVDILVTFEEATYTASEGELIVEACVVTSATPDPGQTIAALVSTEDGTAIAGSDYIATVNQALIFTSESPQRQCVAVGILDDQVIEDLEQFVIRVDQTLPQRVVSNIASVFITDDDEQNILITFELDSYSVLEGQPSVEVCAVTSATPDQGQSISAQISTEDGSATAGSDYDPLINEVLTFTSTSPQRQCVNIGVIDDNLVELVEEFVVRLNRADSLQEDEATVSITDNDEPTGDCLVSLFGANTISEESTFISVCVQLDGPTSTDVFINYNTVQRTATADSDYESVSTVLTFSPTPVLAIFCPQVPIINDAIPELDETFEIQISTASCLVAQSTFTVTIQDNDDGVAVLGFSLPTYQVSEGNPSVEICVQSSAPLLESASATLATTDGTATDGLDYVGGEQTISIEIGESEACATFEIIDDDEFESSETFSVALTSTDLMVDPQSSSAVVSIVDNDGIPIVFAEPTYSVREEAGSLEICAVAPDALLVPVDVTVQAEGGTAQAGMDYSGLPGTLSFTPTTDRTQCLTIQIEDDAFAEETETILLLLSGSVNGAPIQAQATVSIIDNDGVGTLTVSLEQDAYSFLENADPASVMVCVDLIETSLNRVVDIQLTLREDSALSNVDFIQETALIRFDPVNSEPVICEMLQLVNDIFFEETEVFFVDLSSSDPAVTFVIQTASISIINDDTLLAVAQFIDSSDFLFIEGDAPNQRPLLDDICVEIVPPGFPGIAQVVVSTTDASAIRGEDYSGVSQTLTFPPGIDELCTSFISILGDDEIEPTEIILISLTPVNTDVGNGPNVIASILDDDEVDEPIVLINDTPDVEINEAAGTASVRVDFTLRSDVVFAECSLGVNFPPTDCTSRTILFEGIPADMREPLPFLVRAFNQLGQEVGNVTRNVRIGFNMDCSVLFINMGTNDLFVFDQDSVLIEWELVGPVENTECRLETRVEGGDDIIGEYSMCDSPHLVQDLPPGRYGVKVRPNGESCARRIRRTIDFTIQ